MSEFNQGYACAISCIVKGHGTGVETREALEANGLTSEKAARDAGVDLSDIEILRPLFKEIQERDARRRKS